MADDRGPVLFEVITGVLETQAFMFADECPAGDLETESASFLHASMTFEGPVRGRIGVMAPVEFCVALAASMLGVEPEEGAAAEGAADALKELLNVVCGQVLTTLHGADPVFRLSIPAAEEADRTGWDAARSREGTIGFLVDESPAIAYLAPA
jgi:CheY-specific phosphatase CheX